MLRALAILLCFLGLLPGLSAQAPLPGDPALAAPALPATAQAAAARSALAQGYPDFAVSLLEALLASPDLPADLRQDLILDLAAAQIALNQLDSAAQTLAPLADADSPRVALRQAFLALLRGRVGEARRLLPSAEANLPADERPWLALLNGLLLEAGGEFEAARLAYAQASSLASGPSFASLSEVLRLRAELHFRPADEQTVAELRTLDRTMRGQRAGFEAGRLLALALHRLNENAEALAVLERLLETPGLREAQMRGPLLLLLALLSGEDSGRARVALRQVIEDPTLDRGLQERALFLLAQQPRDERQRAEFLALLQTWAEAQPPLPLLDQFLILRAHLLAQAGEADAAEATARQVLERFPASPQVPAVLHFLAYLNGQRQVPRYRTAANYLGDLRNRATLPADKAHFAALMADAYFLNRDFATAAGLYTAALPDLPPEARPRVLFQLVQSHLQAGRLDEAQAQLEASLPLVPLDVYQRWEAEWNLLDALRRQGGVETARSRLASLLQRAPLAQFPRELTLRLRWLELRLALDAGQPAVVPGLAVRLQDDLAATPELDDDLQERLAANVLLAQAEALYALAQSNAAAQLLQELRQAYPQSAAAVLSYLLEARQSLSAGSLTSSQQALVQLADLFPNSPYAPLALWEAALAAERQALPRTLEEAIGILERLAQSYPEHPLIFHVRLKQAALSRQLNDFPAADALYTALARRYPDHPERFRADLGRADGALARTSQNPASLVDAEILYQQVWNRPAVPLPVRAEAAYKWGLAQQMQGNAEQARASWWLAWSVLGEAAREQGLDHRGRYWLARLGLNLAESLVAAGRPADAQRLYQELTARGLPGSVLAEGRLTSLSALSPDA